MVHFYGGIDPSDMPLYSYAAAARTLKLPNSTVRWWVQGRDQKYEPVLKADSGSLLSFKDLLELYVVKVLRKNRGVTLPAIRRAVAYAEQLGIRRVLLSENLATYAGNVLLAGLSETVAISLSGQRLLHELIDGLIERIDRDVVGAPVLHPDFVGEQLSGAKLPVSVSPVVAFGAPTISGTGIRTSMAKARVDSGEKVDEVASDYDVPPALITAAVYFEHAAA